jgi:hypothetical protein
VPAPVAEVVDFSTLSVKLLKQKLKEKGIKHSDCIEKSDLVERLKSNM